MPAAGDSLAVQKIINEGTYINEPDCRGYTPLMYAIWTGNLDVQIFLINNGAELNAKDEDALHLLCGHRVMDIQILSKF